MHEAPNTENSTEGIDVALETSTEIDFPSSIERDGTERKARQRNGQRANSDKVRKAPMGSKAITG